MTEGEHIKVLRYFHTLNTRLTSCGKGLCDICRESVGQTKTEADPRTLRSLRESLGTAAILYARLHE